MRITLKLALAFLLCSALICQATTYLSSTSLSVTPTNLGFWYNSINTSNPTAGITTDVASGTQWVCYAQEQSVGNSSAAPNLTIAKIAPNGAVTIYTPASLPANTNTDQHDACSIALDTNGYIHVTYNMHVSPQVYYRSNNPNDASVFTAQAMLNNGCSSTSTGSITFGLLFTNPTNGALYYTAQCGGGSYGQQLFYSYNVGTTTWSAASGTSTNTNAECSSACAGMLANYTVSGLGGATFLSGLPQWDKTTGYLWFAFNVSANTLANGNCGSSNGGATCGWYLLGWTGSSFIKWDGTAQALPVTLANSSPWYTVNATEDSNFTVLDSVSIDNNGTIFLPYITEDGSNYLQVYALSCPHQTACTSHQLTSNASVLTPPVSAGWVSGCPGTTPGLCIQSVTAISVGTCTWVAYPDIFNWGAGEAAFYSCNNFSTNTFEYLTANFNPNGIIFPDQVQEYNGKITYIFEQVNDVQYRFSTFVNPGSPNIGQIMLTTLTNISPTTGAQIATSGLQISGTKKISGKVAAQ
jgi:BNR repeat-containing family member